MSARKAAVTVYVATAYDACGSYDVTAVGATAAEAERLLKRAVNKARRASGLDPWPKLYLDDLDGNACEMTVGHAYYDEGRAGEVRL